MIIWAEMKMTVNNSMLPVILPTNQVKSMIKWKESNITYHIIFHNIFYSLLSSTCNSANRSEGFEEWKAPEAIKRIKSVFTFPCFVVIQEPVERKRKGQCSEYIDNDIYVRVSNQGTIYKIDFSGMISQHKYRDKTLSLLHRRQTSFSFCFILPSIRGSKSLCTPSEDASALLYSLLDTNLSISSINTIPLS